MLISLTGIGLGTIGAVLAVHTQAWDVLPVSIVAIIVSLTDAILRRVDR